MRPNIGYKGIEMKKLDKTSEHFRKNEVNALIELSKMYTEKDLCEFAEWCSKNDWYYDPGEKVWNCELWGKIYTHTSSQLLKIWEIETGRMKP